MSGNDHGASVTARVSDLVLSRPRRGWWWAFAFALVLTLVFIGAIGYLFATGIGIWGIDIPVAWGFAIGNYVWWIGIGMGGTFISAALLLLRQEWRTSVNRMAESMTVIAVSVSGLFPILHLGRPWFFYWLAPYPNVMNVWPQWRSALVWDFFAIASYLILSILFLYLSSLPDLATLRDRAKSGFRQRFYGLLALGWRGEARHWKRQRLASLLLAGLAVPMVFIVHTMVAMDFATGNTPGWHSTLFPPFFVTGALFSGFAMVLAFGIPLRHIYRLDEVITIGHLEKLGKVLLAASVIMAYSYLVEGLGAVYSGNRYESYLLFHNRFDGAYGFLYWSTILCNAVIPQSLWFRRIRRSPLALATIGLFVVIGMWIERFMLIVTSLYRDFMPSAWGMFYPTIWDWTILAGSIGLFLLLLLVMVRFLPPVSLSEYRQLRFEKEEGQ